VLKGIRYPKRVKEKKKLSERRKRRKCKPA
jgi:hypothetical protein